jgi:hypothetical protein
VNDVSGHKIGNHEWYTASVDWILVGSIMYGPFDRIAQETISGLIRIACYWPTKILFGTAESQALTIVDFELPRAFDSSEQAEVQSLIATAEAQYVEQSSAFLLALGDLLASRLATGQSRLYPEDLTLDLVHRMSGTNPDVQLGGSHAG